MLGKGLGVLYSQHVQGGLGDLVCWDGEQGVVGGRLDGAQGCGARIVSMDALQLTITRDLHVGNLLQATLLEQRQESSSDQVSAGNISLKCRFEVRPFLVSFP